VARSFRGRFSQKVDAKGRVSVPARFRRLLEAGDPDWRQAVADGQTDARPMFTIVFGDDDQNYFECYTVESIEEIDEQIAELFSPGDPQRKDLQELYHENSLEAEIDNDGRVMLPQDLRRKLGIEPRETLLFTGSGETFKIWKPEVYEAERAARRAKLAAERPEGFDARALLPPRKKKTEE